MRKFQPRELREQKYSLWILCPFRTNPHVWITGKLFQVLQTTDDMQKRPCKYTAGIFLVFSAICKEGIKAKIHVWSCYKLIICRAAADKFLIASCHVQTPTLCRTSPALETVRGVTNLSLLRIGHPALPHLIWIKWGKHHKLIPSQRPHPWGHSIHQIQTEAKLWQAKQHKHYKHSEVLLLHPSKWIALSTRLLLNSLCPSGPRDAQSQAAKARLKLKEKQSMFTLCPRTHQYCFWAGTASFCSPEIREQTMAKDFSWHH